MTTKIRWGRIAAIAAVLCMIALIVIALRPSPLIVDVASATRGEMRVTIDEEGEARAHDRYVVSAPVAGRLTRIELHDGDPVRKGAVVATINPTPLDPRETGEARARLQSVEALKREAEEKTAHARADYAQAHRELQRSEVLARGGLISAQALEQARNVEETAANELAAARSRAESAASDVRVAQSALIAIDGARAGGTGAIILRAPAAGRVLRVAEKSEHVVASGTPLIIIGDTSKMEVVADLLTTDAVKVKPGDTMLLERWGGDAPIRARVRLVEASAFTKVSALGVEEQRVNIVADFVDSPGVLSDGYRVEARIVIWESHDVLRVPSSAVFRHGGGWAVFVIEAGRARLRLVQTDQRNPHEVQILDGLAEHEQVIVHPSNQIQDGVLVRAR